MYIFESKYPKAQAEFILDQSPYHKKLPEDALNIHSINVNPGRKQPQMRSTQWNGEEQLIALPDSKPKGMRLVLQERGIDTFGMNSEDMREALSTFTDFQNPKTIVEEYIESCGHICLFLPKYHCELNPIERVWCKAKKFTRAHCTYTLPALRRVIPESLATVTVDDTRKYFRKARDYEKAYRDGKIGAAVGEAVKSTNLIDA